MKTYEIKQGYINRHIEGLPIIKKAIRIINRDVDGDHEYTCLWTPLDSSEYNDKNTPMVGYLGTARVIEGRYVGIGFNAWEDSDNEFVYYSIV